MKINEVIYNPQSKTIMGSNTYSKSDIEDAVTRVFDSPEFKTMSKDFRFISTPKQKLNGTLGFETFDGQKYYWLYATGNLRTSSSIDGMQAKMRVEPPTGNLYQDYIKLLNDLSAKNIKRIKSSSTKLDLSKKNLRTLNGINFDNIKSLDVSRNSLMDLSGCPEQLSSFICDKNDRDLSLVGGPRIVSGNYFAQMSNITSLVGLPVKIGGNLFLNNNSISSLSGCPKTVQEFNCGYNRVPLSLIGGPEIIKGSYSITNSKVSSIEGLPSKIKNLLNLYGNPITSLGGIHKILKSVEELLLSNEIKSNMLGLLLIGNFSKGIRYFSYEHDDAFDNVIKILNKHLKDTRDILECQEELISAGYKEYAKL